MGGEKRGSKSSGFFNLFDWNRKSRKKLFSGGSSSPERTKTGKRAGESVLHYQLGLIDEDEITGAASVEGSSDYSCASSVTDEEGHVMKAPGVVARLMGLDSLPTSGVSEPYNTPLFDTKSLSCNHSQMKSPSCYSNDQFGYSRKTVELRTPKMPSSPIERFQTEMVPPRSAKSLPITHHKLFSPVKNPGFISPKNAAHIMEAAVKILEPGLQPSTSRSRTSLFGTPSVPLKVRDSKDVSAAPQRTSRLPETSRRLDESSSVRSLKGPPLNKSWNSSDDTLLSKSSLDTEESNPGCSKGKGKSVSLAVQAKVNVQRREGMNVGNRNVGGRKNREQCEVGQPFKSQKNNQRSRQLVKASVASSSTVLRQNNQKQNSTTSREKLAKNKAGDAASAKNKSVNNAAGSSKVSYRKGDILTTDFDGDDLTQGTRNYPRKKRLIERESYSPSSSLVDKVQTDGLERRVQQNVVIDEHLRWLDDNRTNGSDIVSFTFTSPLVKPISRSQLSRENSGVSSSNKQKPFLRSNIIGGDALNFLLEQKLKELTARIDLSSCDLLSSSSTATSSTTLQEPASIGHAPDSAPMQMNKEFLFSDSADDLSCVSDCAISLTTDQVLSKSNNLQEAERAEPSYSVGAPKENRHPSPLSILDASFSNESCNSSESWESTGSKICSSCVQPQELDSTSPTTSAENELDLTDSASSFFMETIYDENVMQTRKDLDFVKDIIIKSRSIWERIFKTLEPLAVDVSENKGNGTEKEDSSRMKKRLFFDCVNECLDMKYSRYFRAGYCAWTKGVMAVSDELAEELYKEILQWKSMGDKMVDELVDKDMSTNLGRWVDFEIEAFEAGVEVEREIFDCLVDEIVCDIRSKGSVDVTYFDF